MPELTDFLLARIAEDEADQFGMDGWCGEWRCQPSTARMEAARARVLAECEAKRRIVRRCRRERGRHDQFGDSLGNPIQAVVAWETAVRILATPYADHPDYRQEWTP